LGDEAGMLISIEKSKGRIKRFEEINAKINTFKPSIGPGDLHRQRAPVFGQIQDGAAILTPSGIIAREEWFKIADLRKNVRLDKAEFGVMPNHVHGLFGSGEGKLAMAVRWRV
jgi:hypothetical protein